MQAIFRFLRGYLGVFALGLLPLQALLAQSAQAHEFVVAIRAVGAERDLVLADALRGFLLATKERDGHPDETSNGHLGGLDVYIIPQTGENIVGFPMLTKAPSDRSDITLVIGASGAVDAVLEQAGKERPAMRAGALHSANLWRSTAPSNSAGFAARYNLAYQQPASKWAADGYNAARRIDDAVRLFGGVDDRAALERALAATAGGFQW